MSHPTKQFLQPLDGTPPDLTPVTDQLTRKFAGWKLFTFHRTASTTKLHLLVPPRGRSLATLTRRKDGTLHYQELGQPSPHKPVLPHNYNSLYDPLKERLTREVLHAAIRHWGPRRFLSARPSAITSASDDAAKTIIARVTSTALFPSGHRHTGDKPLHHHTHRLIKTHFTNPATLAILEEIRPRNLGAPTISEYNRAFVNRPLFTEILLTRPYLLRHYCASVPAPSHTPPRLTAERIESQLAAALDIHAEDLQGLRHTPPNTVTTPQKKCLAEVFSSIPDPIPDRAIKTIIRERNLLESAKDEPPETWQHILHALRLLTESAADEDNYDHHLLNTVTKHIIAMEREHTPAHRQQSFRHYVQTASGTTV